jgi:hypothetical protein
MARKAWLSMDANPGVPLKTGWREGSRRPGDWRARYDSSDPVVRLERITAKKGIS